MASQALDLMLVPALLATAGGALLSRNLFRAVVLFIAFGLVMSLAWVRLRAPDLALAEAAIGAGLAGALLLDAVGHLDGGRKSSPRALPLVEIALCLGLLVVLIYAVVLQPAPSRLLNEMLQSAMPDSGVTHEVTAVLLNFRGYDTFLEISVLMVAAFISLGLQSQRPEPPPLPSIDNDLLNNLVAWLAPIMLLVTVYVFWVGSKEPGGAFQAAALLAAAAVLLRLAGTTLPYLGPGFPLRLGLGAGLCLFLVLGLGGPLAGQPLFSYPASLAGLMLVGLEAVLTLSIGITLLSLLTSGRPLRKEDPADES